MGSDAGLVQRATQVFLGHILAINWCRVEVRNPEVMRACNRVPLLLRRAVHHEPGRGPAAEAYLRNLDARAAKLAVLHTELPPRRRGRVVVNAPRAEPFIDAAPETL